MIGPAVAGICISALGTGWAFMINGVSFVAVVGSLLFLRQHELHRHDRAGRAGSGMLEGFRYVWHRPDLRAILVMLFLIGTFGLNFQIFISTMAVSVFHIDAAAYGVLTSTMAVGTIAGALLAAGRERQRFELLWIGTLAFGIGCAIAALMPNPLLFGAALIPVGVASLTITNSSNSLMQLATEPAMRGRVMAIRLAIVLGATPLGAPLVGWTADRFGPRWGLGVGAASGFLAAIVGLVYLRARVSQASDPGCAARP
jgi:MFS family permease